MLSLIILVLAIVGSRSAALEVLILVLAIVGSQRAVLEDWTRP